MDIKYKLNVDNKGKNTKKKMVQAWDLGLNSWNDVTKNIIQLFLIILIVLRLVSISITNKK